MSTQGGTRRSGSAAGKASAPVVQHIGLVRRTEGTRSSGDNRFRVTQEVHEYRDAEGHEYRVTYETRAGVEPHIVAQGTMKQINARTQQWESATASKEAQKRSASARGDTAVPKTRTTAAGAPKASAGKARSASAKPVADNATPRPDSQTRTLNNPTDPQEAWATLGNHNHETFYQALRQEPMGVLEAMAHNAGATSASKSRAAGTQRDALARAIADKMAGVVRATPAKAASKRTSSTKAARPQFTVVNRIRNTGLLGPDKPINPYLYKWAYGDAQIHGMMARFPASALKQAAAIVERHNPGTKPTNRSQKQALVDYIVAHVNATPVTSEDQAAHFAD